MSAWAWAIVGRPEGLRVELPDGRAVVLEGPLPAAVAALLAWAAGPDGCEVPPVAPSRPGASSRDVVGSTDGSAKSTNAARQARHRERLRLAKLGASVTEPVTEGVTRNATSVTASVTSNAQSVTLVTPPSPSRALSDLDLPLGSSSDSLSFSANSSISEEEKNEIACTETDAESVTRNALPVTHAPLRNAVTDPVTRNAPDAPHPSPALSLEEKAERRASFIARAERAGDPESSRLAVPGLSLEAPKTKAARKAEEQATRARLRAEKAEADLQAATARAEAQALRKAAREAKTAPLPGSAPLSADWAPTEGHAKTAAEKGLDLHAQAARFRAKADEKGRTFRDRRHENACFTTWLLSPYARPEPPPSSRPGLVAAPVDPAAEAHRAAYLAGLLEGGVALAVVWGAQEDAQLRAVLVHAKSEREHDEGQPLTGERLVTWHRLEGRAFARWMRDPANAKELPFYSGGQPKGFVRWINEERARREQRAIDGRVERR